MIVSIPTPTYWGFSDAGKRPTADKLHDALLLYRERWRRDPARILLHPQDLADARLDQRFAIAGIALVENPHVARHTFYLEHPEETTR